MRRTSRVWASAADTAAAAVAPPRSTPAMSVLPPFPGLPPTQPIENLPAPQMQLSKLSNGLRVASQETYGQLCNFGLFIDAGSRIETKNTTGTTQLMELMAFKSTFRRSHEQMHMDIAEMGGSTMSFATRDLILYNIEVLRESLEPAMELLAETVLIPQLLDEEVEEMKMVMELQTEQLPPEVLLKEAIHEAAFGATGSLGQPHYCPPEAVANLCPRMLQEHRAQFYQAPRMVLVGAGVDHEEFLALGDRYFSAVPPGSSSSTSSAITSPYLGGEKRIQRELAMKNEFCHVSLAWMTTWDNIEDRVPLCVMQVLLGAVQSFSAGGPGKGMYSRLYREVLNRHGGVEAAEAHIEASGLFGIMGACSPEYATELVYSFASQFAKLCDQDVSEEELSRARNMLKCNVLTCLESHHMVFEDIGQQLLCDSTYISPAEVCERIDRVTAADIRRVATLALSNGPSIACIGEDISRVPDHRMIKSWFRI